MSGISSELKILKFFFSHLGGNNMEEKKKEEIFSISLTLEVIFDSERHPSE